MIFDTVYSIIPLIALAIVAYVMRRKRQNKWNWAVWGGMAFFYISYVLLQEVASSNSPSLQSLFLSVLVGSYIAVIAVKTKTGWPLLISLLLLSNGMMDFNHYTTTAINGLPNWNRAYQDVGAALYYLALFVVMVHPKIRPLELRNDKSWRHV